MAMFSLFGCSPNPKSSASMKNLTSCAIDDSLLLAEGDGKKVLLFPRGDGLFVQDSGRDKTPAQFGVLLVKKCDWNLHLHLSNTQILWIHRTRNRHFRE